MLTQSANSPSLNWQRSQNFPLARQIEIFRVALGLIFFLLWDSLTGNNSAKTRKKRAQWLVRKLLHLGPTFIKIGQSLSTRVDLIPLEYIEELVQLQDRVPPFSSQEAIAVIESELGQTITPLFKDFDSTPLASASLGQVHKALLPSGEEVVIKVQRPGLESLFKLDCTSVNAAKRIATSVFKFHRLMYLAAFLSFPSGLISSIGPTSPVSLYIFLVSEDVDSISIIKPSSVVRSNVFSIISLFLPLISINLAERTNALIVEEAKLE